MQVWKHHLYNKQNMTLSGKIGIAYQSRPNIFRYMAVSTTSLRFLQKVKLEYTWISKSVPELYFFYVSANSTSGAMNWIIDCVNKDLLCPCPSASRTSKGYVYLKEFSIPCPPEIRSIHTTRISNKKNKYNR